MGWSQVVFVLTSLLVTLATGHHIPGHQLSLLPPQKHFPPSNTLIFQRDVVESSPRDGELEYGSWSLPLRTAVEFVPTDHAAHRSPMQNSTEVSFKSPEKSSPLRDAVEHRVPPSFGGFDHESFWLEQISPPAIRKHTYPLNVICHIDTESIYREEPFILLPRSVPAHKCTHLVYMAATLHPQEFTIIPRDFEYDIVRGGYIAAVGQRRRDPSLRVLISITSPDHGRLFREILTEPEERLPSFVDSLLDFIEEHDFDGAEIDWDSATASSLKIILRHLRGSFLERGFNLVVAIRPEQLADGELAELADLLVLRAWHSRRVAEVVQSPAPLSFVRSFVESLTRKGIPSSKIIVGFPFFGWSYKLAFNDDGVSTLANGFGIDGPYTKHRGQLAYYEICEKLEDPWLHKRHEINGSYIILGDQWIGYDDPLSVKIKAAYVKSANLGGVSLFSLDLDDFQGICGDEWPMFNAAMKTLGIYDEPDEKCPKSGLYSDPDNCSGFLSCFNGRLYRGNCGIGRFYDPVRGRCVPASPEVCDPGHSDQYSYVSQHLERLRQQQRLERLEIAEEASHKVICYVTSWAMYRKGAGKFVPEHLDARLCTDVVYAFAGLNPETLIVHSFDPWADIENNLYQRVTSITGPKVLLALGGWTDSAGDKYSRLVSSAASRRKFVASTVHFLRKHNFQGLSVEWNYPGCWQSQCRRGPETDKPNFTRLLAELRREFDHQEPKLTLAVALSGYKEVIDKGYDVAEISKLVDFMTVMSYDYHGAWEGHTSHLAPLFAIPGDSSPYNNLNFTLNYLVKLGADRSKLIVDVPMYGQSYKLASPDHYELGDAAAGPGIAGEYTRQPGMLAYHEICERIEKDGWIEQLGPSSHYKDQFVSFDNAKSIGYKGQYILKNDFGGAAAWTVDLDDFTNRCCQEPFPLLRSINRALGRLLTPAPSHKDCKKPDEPITPHPPTLTPHPDGNDGQPLPSRPSTSSTTWPTWTEVATSKPSNWNKPTTSWQKPTTQMTWWPTTSITTTTTTTTRRPSKPSITRPTPTPSTANSLAGTPCNSGEHKPNPSDCGTYYRCVLGEFRREFCAPGLHWDSTRRLCDWPAAAKCDKRKPASVATTTSTTTKRPTYTTTRRPTYTTTTPLSISTTKKPETDDCEHGQYYPYPGSCTAFLVCVNGNLVRQQCGPGLNWNEAKNMCDWAFKAPCDEKKKKIQSTNSMMKLNNIKNGDLSCTNSGGYLPVPGDCESYYACLWGKLEKFHCAPGLHFNAESHICDWPVRSKCVDNSNNDVGIVDASEIPLDPVDPDYTTQKPWKPPSQATTTALPSAEIDPNAISPLSGHFKIVCYFTNWAWYRRGVGRYLPENIDHTLCTHIVYGFAVLDYSNLVMKAHDSWADYDNHFYERVVAYKKRGIKVSLALGGWNDSQGDKYSRLVNNPAARRRFIEHALQFIQKYDFDGLDLDWEYPVCWQTECNKGPASDKESFTAWVRELSEAFRPRGLLLSTAVSPSKKIIDAGYDVPELSKYFDWISVMTYDYHGQWDKRTGHVAPMYYHDDDEFYYFNANYTINYWIAKGAPPRTLVMGMPLYGQAFTLKNASLGIGLNSPASAGAAGEFTKAAGFLAYYEICDRINSKGWQVVQDPQRRMGPYAYKGKQWVGFDDADMIRQKAQYVRDMGLGGGMVWALDLDDFRGKCGQGPHPLMRSLQQVLADPPNKHDRPIKPPQFGQELEWQVPSAPPSKLEQLNLNDPVTEDEYKVVCYFTNWAWYRQGHGKYLPEDIDADLCSHIVYGFAVLNGDSLTITTHDSWADIDNRFYERVVAYKAKGKKVLIAIGGWNDSAGEKYSKLVNNPSARKRFVETVIQFIEKYGFDGLDLDWEYPVCWQVDCTKGPKSDKQGFTALVRELSEAFRPRGLLLTSAVSPNHRVITEGYDVPVLAELFDWIAVMSYDYHGQWDKKTGHNAPFYVRPDDWDKTFNANYSIHFWLDKGAPPKKLVMGMPLYGQSFSLAEKSENGLNAPTYGGGEAGDDTRARGFLSYYEICQRTLTNGWTVVQDSKRRIGPYAYLGDQWVSFDDAEQLRRKSEYIKQMGLGGGMVWALDLDDFKNVCNCEPYPLLRTINRVLRNYPAGPTCTVSSSIVTESEPIPGKPTTEKPTTSWTWSPPSSTTTWSWTTTTEIPTDIITEDVDTIEIDAGDAPPPHDQAQASCRDSNKLFVAHKSDCHKYYLCNFGQLTEQTCPNGLHWNNDHCDWPENSKCKARYNGVSMSNSQRLKEDPLINGRKVVCYFTSWSSERQGSGKFLPEDIDPSLCTHVIYSFASLDPVNLSIKSRDRSTDIDDNFYARVVTTLKKKGVKVLLGLGGWKDSGTDKYSRMVNNPVARVKFVTDTIKFVVKYGFSGLNIDWNYPVCWQGDCSRGPASDKKSFAALIRQLGTEFHSRNLLLTASVSPNKQIIDNSYDVPTLAKYLDWLGVMSYDYHGQWEKKTGPIAPLYFHAGDEFDQYNVNFTMQYWISKGAPSKKLIMGVPFYGQSFTLENPTYNGWQAPTTKLGKPAKFTRASGFMAYYEICNNAKKNNWSVMKDPDGRIGAYATHGDQWVAYEDVSDVTGKAEYIKEHSLGGGMIWALDLDDFKNVCGCGKYPLLNAFNRGLRDERQLQDCT